MIEYQVKKEHPTLKQFKEQIDKYEGIHEQVAFSSNYYQDSEGGIYQVKEMEDSKTFQSWFLVDITPFKMALLNGIKKWSYAFKKHLTDDVVNSLSELNNFIDKADEGLMTQVAKT